MPIATCFSTATSRSSSVMLSFTRRGTWDKIFHRFNIWEYAWLYALKICHNFFSFDAKVYLTMGPEVGLSENRLWQVGEELFEDRGTLVHLRAHIVNIWPIPSKTGLGTENSQSSRSRAMPRFKRSFNALKKKVKYLYKKIKYLNSKK